MIINNLNKEILVEVVVIMVGEVETMVEIVMTDEDIMIAVAMIGIIVVVMTVVEVTTGITVGIMIVEEVTTGITEEVMTEIIAVATIVVVAMTAIIEVVMIGIVEEDTIETVDLVMTDKVVINLIERSIARIDVITALSHSVEKRSKYVGKPKIGFGP